MPEQATIVWFRHDLRLADQPALAEAAARGVVAPVYIWAPEEEGDWPPGGASRWWLHRSLESLASDLERLGTPLVIRRGASLACLQELVAETGADAVYWNRRYEPAIIARDQQIKTALQDQGLEVQSFNGSLLFEPGEIQTKQGKPYQVFTPFWKTCLGQNQVHDPLAAPAQTQAIGKPLVSCAIEELRLQPTIDWDAGLREHWQVGSTAAHERLRRFLAGPVAAYKKERDRMDLDATSQLAAHLHFGEISPREVWTETQAAIAANPEAKTGADCFLSEVGWREFAYHLLFHFPTTVTQPLREPFAKFPWRDDKQALRQWQQGQTGVPLVDA
ncbi:MAG: DNA photolyase family protein, partial [Pirellulales bacterium]|nr:DNA photolyase family protein [Pirellulales bacterium]